MKNYLNKGLWIIGILLIQLSSVSAQDLTINVHETYILDDLGSEMIFGVDVTNNSSEEMIISVVRTKNEIPENWTSPLCFDLCFAPFIDSICTTPDYGSSPLAAGETREVSVHVFPNVIDGVGYVTINIINEQNRSESYSVDFEAATILVSVDETISTINYKLDQNYPNPFNPSTIINYSVGNNNGTSEFVSLKVFDAIGREVATLVNSIQTAGSYSVKFNSKDFGATSGIYFYELKTDNFHQVNKMVLEK